MGWYLYVTSIARYTVGTQVIRQLSNLWSSLRVLLCVCQPGWLFKLWSEVGGVLRFHAWPKAEQTQRMVGGTMGCPAPQFVNQLWSSAILHLLIVCFWTKPSTLLHIISLWTKWLLIGKKLTHISTKYEDLLTSNNSSHGAHYVESTGLEALHILSVVPTITPKAETLVSWVIRQSLRYATKYGQCQRISNKEAESQCWMHCLPCRSECKAYHPSATGKFCASH